MDIQQLKAGQILVGDYLLNLGEVSRIEQSNGSIKLCFKQSLARIFTASAICYIAKRELVRRSHWGGENGKPSTRKRATARKGVSVE